MRGDMIQLLLYEAKRRPAIAALVARAHDLTDEEIDQFPFPLPWFRIALRKLRDQKIWEARRSIIETGIVQGVTIDQSGDVRQWGRLAAFVRTSRGGMVQIREGDIVFITDKGVWFDTLFSDVIDPDLIEGSHPLGPSTLSAYKETVRARTNRLLP